MPYRDLLLEDVPELSTKTAMELIDTLYALADALSNRYYAQIRDDPDDPDDQDPRQYDLFKSNLDPPDFDDPLPKF
jgi:hypothetical protein